MTAEEICTLALEEFEVGHYRTCVEYLIAVYEQGGNKQEILNFLYQNFVYPNVLEFQMSYEKTQEKFWELKYDDLSLDFIPVSDEEFFLYDKEYECFRGIVDFKELALQKEKLIDPFNGYVFADIWDIRAALPYSLSGAEGQLFYFITSDASRTASFAKIPGFMDMFAKNICFLPDLEVFEKVFCEFPDFYLPKVVGAEESTKKINAIIDTVHQQRIENIDVERKNILLSICIPSYNRGTRALQNVKHLLELRYDSEIEIIVSNNGSVQNTGGYEEIKQIKDSRLKYHELPENAGISGNVLQVLRMAQGRYAVFCSDEDLMIREKLPEYLKILRESKIKGVIHSSGCGTNLVKSPDGLVQICGSRIEAARFASELNYITGIFLNMEALKKCNCLNIVKNMLHNEFVRYYPHNTIAMMLAYHYSAYAYGTRLWIEGEPAEASNEQSASYPIYVTIEKRKELFEDYITLVPSVCPITGRELCELYKKKASNVLWLLETGHFHYPQYYEENGYTTDIVREKIRQFCIEDIQLIREWLTDDEAERLKAELMLYDFVKPKLEVMII